MACREKLWKYTTIATLLVGATSLSFGLRSLREQGVPKTNHEVFERIVALSVALEQGKDVTTDYNLLISDINQTSSLLKDSYTRRILQVKGSDKLRRFMANQTGLETIDYTLGDRLLEELDPFLFPSKHNYVFRQMYVDTEKKLSRVLN